MINARSIAVILVIGLLATTASLVVGRAISEPSGPPGGYLRGAPSAFLVDYDPSRISSDEAMELIIPERPRIGPVFLVPFAYDWLVWSAATVVVLGAAWIGRRWRTTRTRGSISPTETPTSPSRPHSS